MEQRVHSLCLHIGTTFFKVYILSLYLIYLKCNVSIHYGHAGTTQTPQIYGVLRLQILLL